MNSVECNVIVKPNGITEYRVNGSLHRLDGPAAIYYDNCREWLINGEEQCF